jgi:hypothetical protein
MILWLTDCGTAPQAMYGVVTIERRIAKPTANLLVKVFNLLFTWEHGFSLENSELC